MSRSRRTPCPRTRYIDKPHKDQPLAKRPKGASGSRAYSGTEMLGPSSNCTRQRRWTSPAAPTTVPRTPAGDPLGERLGRDHARADVDVGRCRSAHGVASNAQNRPKPSVVSLTTNSHGCGSTGPVGVLGDQLGAPGAPGHAATGAPSSANPARSAVPVCRPIRPPTAGPAAVMPRARRRAQRADRQLVAHAQQAGRGLRAVEQQARGGLAVRAVVELQPRARWSTPYPASRPRVTRCEGTFGSQRPVGAVGQRERQAQHRQPRVPERAQVLGGGRGRPRARRSPRTDTRPAAVRSCTTTGTRRRSTASTSGCPSGTE